MSITLKMRILTLAAGLLSMPGAAASPQSGWDPCGSLRDPRVLWDCWAGRAGGHEGVKAATCAAKNVCPPLDQRGKPVLNCYYERGFSTGFRCILFCNYGGPYPWGSDGGNNCN